MAGEGAHTRRGDHACSAHPPSVAQTLLCPTLSRPPSLPACLRQVVRKQAVATAAPQLALDVSLGQGSSAMPRMPFDAGTGRGVQWHRVVVPAVFVLAAAVARFYSVSMQFASRFGKHPRAPPHSALLSSERRHGDAWRTQHGDDVSSLPTATSMRHGCALGGPPAPGQLRPAAATCCLSGQRESRRGASRTHIVVLPPPSYRTTITARPSLYVFAAPCRPTHAPAPLHQPSFPLFPVYTAQPFPPAAHSSDCCAPITASWLQLLRNNCDNSNP